MIANCKIKIGDMIARDFRTASLFFGYQIDLLRDRDKTIEAVCKDKEINLLHLMNDLNDILTSNRTLSSDYSSWPLRFLTNLITIRHCYLRENLPVIQQFLDRLSEIHNGHNQHIVDLCKGFSAWAERLTLSLQKPVPILFSSIKQVIHAEEDNVSFAGPAFETVSYFIKKLTEELSLHRKSFLAVVELINRYIPSSNACSCYKLSQDLLTELKNDLYKIIGLQNILYNRIMILRN